MTKTVSQNNQEMLNLLTEAVAAKQEWAINLVQKHGSVAAAVSSI